MILLFFLMIRRPPRSTLDRSSAASEVYKRQGLVPVRVGDETRRASARDVVDPAERRRVGELMGTKYPWDGDASIGLTFEAWCFDVPALAIESWTSHAT